MLFCFQRAGPGLKWSQVFSSSDVFAVHYGIVGGMDETTARTVAVHQGPDVQSLLGVAGAAVAAGRVRCDVTNQAGDKTMRSVSRTHMCSCWRGNERSITDCAFCVPQKSDLSLFGFQRGFQISCTRLRPEIRKFPYKIMPPYKPNFLIIGDTESRDTREQT